MSQFRNNPAIPIIKVEIIRKPGVFMGQTVEGGQQYINVNERYKNGQDIHAASDFFVEKNRYTEGKSDVYKEDLIGYKYERDNESYRFTAADNFEEYIKNRQEKVREEGNDADSLEEKSREEAKKIARSLNSEEIKQLKMMGIDVGSACLSDIMGIVNTMRGNAHREELARMLADISVGNGDTEGVTCVGGNVKIAGSDVEISSVDVADIMIEENSAEESEAGFRLSENELLYIIKNDLNFTEENMYKAHFSGSTARQGQVDDRLFNEMLPQIEKVLEQAGMEDNETAVSGARFLLANNLPITPDNINIYVDYQTYQDKKIDEVSFKEITGEDAEKKAARIFREVASVNPDTIRDMVREGRQLTLASIFKYEKNDRPVTSDIVRNDAKEISALRQLEEIRLSMTMDAAVRLVKSDFNIDVRELSKVVSRLRNMEENMIKNQLREAGVEATEENISLYQELNTKVTELGKTHAGVIATPLKGAEFSVNSLLHQADNMTDGAEYETVKRDVRYRSFEAATESYEAVGTAPRADMGDSMSKAFSNISDILKDMGLADNYENERAVRILGYNSMEITPDNIAGVAEYDRQVNQLMDTFYPEAVLYMIKDGINPLDVPIDELNDIVRAHNYNEGVTEAENFATYLRDMEKQGLVSSEERESYIGIYRAMNKLAKSGDREAGWIFNNGGQLTVRNLIAAMRSRRAAGLDVSIDKSFGMLMENISIDRDIEKQIDSGFAEQYILSMTEADAETEQFLTENHIKISGVNVAAAENILKNSGGIYQMVSDILSKLRFKTNTKDDLIDEETENIKDSIKGEDVLLPFRPESILESLRGSEEMSIKYNDLRNRVTELMYEAGIEGNLTGMDISAIKTVSAGFNIMSSMAKNHRYKLPVNTEDGVRILNLTIEKNSTNSGTIDISVENERMGNVTAMVKVDGENKLYGHIIASLSDGNYRLKDMAENIQKELTANNFDGAAMDFGTVSRLENMSGFSDTPVETLYQASVALVKAMSTFLK